MICYLIDLDGTLLVDSHAVNGAVEFISELNRRGREYLLITNGSTNAPETLSQLLYRENIEIEKERIITSAELTAAYLAKYHSEKTVYCIGSVWLKKCLEKANIKMDSDSADMVLTGYDEHISIALLNKAIDLILNGAGYISTNDDLCIPSGKGVKPHTGCINQILYQATEKKPIIIGKPSQYFLEMIQQRTQAESFCMIGDSMKTDVNFAIKNNMKMYLVESKVTEMEMIRCHKLIQKVKNLKTIIQYL
jgi:HAD superfamily hydrolase (TIGR01450 family)